MDSGVYTWNYRSLRTAHAWFAHGGQRALGLRALGLRASLLHQGCKIAFDYSFNTFIRPPVCGPPGWTAWMGPPGCLQSGGFMPASSCHRIWLSSPPLNILHVFPIHPDLARINKKLFFSFDKGGMCPALPCFLVIIITIECLL